MANLNWFSNYEGEFKPGHGLGRRLDKKHASREFASFAESRLSILGTTIPKEVNVTLPIRYDYIPKYDQGSEGACVGFGWSWAMSFLNKRFYAARKLYLEAQFIDPFNDTPPEEGTSVTAGARVLLQQGHWRFARGLTFPVAASEGISNFYSATTVDEIRAAHHAHLPVVYGFDWFADFDNPVWTDAGKGGARWWIGLNKNNLGRIRGGHCVCSFGARDENDSIRIVNNWGRDYPIVNMPYETLQFCLNNGAEAIIPVDR